MSNVNNYAIQEFVDQAEPQEAKGRSRADIAAEFANQFLMHRHRGVIDCGDHFIIYGNDGYATDQRSRIELAEVWGRLRNCDPEHGLSINGQTWALVLTDYKRELFDEVELDELVWNTWMEICERFTDKPFELVNPEGVIPEDSNWEPVRATRPSDVEPEWPQE